MELRVGSRFRLGRKIGSGSFGDIYLGKSLNEIIYLCIKVTAAFSIYYKNIQILMYSMIYIILVFLVDKSV